MKTGGKNGFAFRQPLHLWTPLEPTEVQRRLEACANQVTHQDFVVGARPPASHLPRIRGHYQAAQSGTYLVLESVVLAPALLGALVALAVMPIALVVLGVLMAGRYGSDRKALGALHRHLRIAETGARAQARLQAHQTSDPTEAGAVTGAPPSFSVRTGFDGATFHLQGAGGSSRRMEISQQGIRLHRSSGPLRIDWVDLDLVDLQQGMLLLKRPGGTEMIDVVDHTEEDRIWLAVYLQSCNQRWSPVRATHERERQRLAALAARGKRST